MQKIDYESIIEAGQPWCDPFFPADETSIYDNDFPKDERTSRWADFEWKRPSEIYNQQEEKFCLYDTIGPHDIEQG